MSLPTLVVDRLFSRLAATYGAAWDRSMGQAPIGDVKTAWSHELHGFSNDLGSVAWALENLPERCPNVIEFRNLCRKAPVPEAPRLPEPKADPERLRSELAKLQPILAAKQASSVDRLAWARSIVERKEAGGIVAALPLRMAREALANRREA